MAYVPPGIVLTATGAQPLITAGPAAKTILVLATFPQGPRFPVTIQRSEAYGLFGDPAAPGNANYTGPTFMYFAGAQRAAQPSSVQYLVCRVGVTPAQIAAGLNGIVFTGEGPYAGSAGNGLQVVAAGTAGTSSYLLTIQDSTGKVLQQFSGAQYNLTTAQAVANVVNGANPLSSPYSVAQAALGSLTTPPAVGTYTLAGGADGKAATATDPTIATLLQQSLAFYADYIWAGFDAGAIGTTLLAHINTAMSPPYSQWRKAILGPAQGNTFATLSGTYNNFNSDRVVLVGHDAAYGFGIASGLSGQAYDGFHLAGAYAGLKASGATRATGTRQPLAGFNNIAAPTDQTNGLSATQLNTLGGGGFLLFEQSPGGGPIGARDALTTAPQTVNGSPNLMSQFSARDIDDSFSRAMATALYPFTGQTTYAPSQQVNLMSDAARAAADSMGQDINGLRDVNTSYVRAAGSYTTRASYYMPYPLLQLPIQTSFTIG